MNEEQLVPNEELERAHTELERANADLENLLAGTRIAALFLDPDETIRRVTAEATTVYSLRPEDRGRPLADFTHRARRMPPLPSRDELLAAEGPIEHEVEMLDGRVLLRRVIPDAEHDGTPSGTIVTFLDVTDRRRDADRLRDSEALYRAIGESIDYGVWVCDPEGRNVYASESFLRLVGLTQEECSAFGWGEVLHPDDRERTIAAWKECVRTGGAWDIEHRFRGGDGRWHPVLARGVPVRDERGHVRCWAGINLDIGRLKETEAALRASDQRKDEFLAMLAHELRNPLAAVINANAVAARADAGDATRRWSHQVIERQARQLTRMVDDLLDLSRITSGKIRLRKRRVDARDVLRRALDGVRRGFEQKRQELRVGIAETPLPLEADPARLEQVFVNVLSNATRFTRQRGTIDVTAAVEDGQAVVRVEDTGVGIAPELLPHVFEAFTQADVSLDRTEGGLGLGLAVVKRLVEEHGGWIRAESAGVGHGSEFVLAFPLADGTLDERPLEHAAPRDAAGRGRRVLVVEDNVDGAEALSLLLEGLGHTVAIVHDGNRALDQARAFRPEVVLLDLGLPGRDGYSVARALRDDPALPACRIVALSGYGQQRDRDRSREAGIDHHLVKPVDLPDLMKLLG